METIIRSLVSSENSQELYDSDILKALVPDISEDDQYDYDIKDERPDKMLDDNYSDEVSNISIDEMERMLKNAREKGATHVGIFYHSDHMEYEVYGYKHELADEAYLERKAEEARVTEELRKHAAILKLKKQATELGLDITIN